MKEFFTKYPTFALALTTLGSCFIIISVILIESKEKDVQLFVLGALTSIVGNIVSYYFGASEDKQSKHIIKIPDETIKE